MNEEQTVWPALEGLPLSEIASSQDRALLEALRRLKAVTDVPVSTLAGSSGS